MKNARGHEMKCQEASSMSVNTYIPCGLPAIAIVDNGDSRPYWMCAGCADHNEKNRGAVVYSVVEKVVSYTLKEKQG